MLARTDTGYAPWTVIAANDKRRARLTAMRAVVTALAESVDAAERPAQLHMPEF
jgi:polyphosphate kinase 2 (PPK2 family)